MTRAARGGWKSARHVVEKLEIDATDGCLYATCGCGSEFKIEHREREVRGRESSAFRRGGLRCPVPDARTERVYFDHLLGRARVLCVSCIDAWLANGLDARLDDLGPAPYSAPCENCLAENRLVREAGADGAG